MSDVWVGSSSKPKVGVVILNYQHDDDTVACFESLQRSSFRNLEPVVVDNDSDLDVKKRLRASLPRQLYLQAEDNLGYAAGNNIGIRVALERGADLIWILNPDTVVEPDTLDELVDTLMSYPGIGILGPRILEADTDPPRIWCDGGIVDWERGGATSHRNLGRLNDDVPSHMLIGTDYVVGASMLVRREVFEHVGLLPEQYFLYYEETDFNLQAAAFGWGRAVQPRAQMWHARRAQGALPKPYYIYYLIRNRLVFSSRFAGYPPEKSAADLEPFISTWRKRVEESAPTWVATFESLVERALSDGRQGRQGQVRDLPPPAE